MSYLNWFKFWRQFNWDTAYFHYTPYFFSLVNTPIPFIEVDHMSYNDDLGRPRRALTIHNPDLVQTLTMNWWYLCDILWIQCWHQWRRKACPSRGSCCRPRPPSRAAITPWLFITFVVYQCNFEITRHMNQKLWGRLPQTSTRRTMSVEILSTAAYSGVTSHWQPRQYRGPRGPKR